MGRHVLGTVAALTVGAAGKGDENGVGHQIGALPRRHVEGISLGDQEEGGSGESWEGVLESRPLVHGHEEREKRLVVVGEEPVSRSFAGRGPTARSTVVQAGSAPITTAASSICRPIAWNRRWSSVGDPYFP